MTLFIFFGGGSTVALVGKHFISVNFVQTTLVKFIQLLRRKNPNDIDSKMTKG